MKTIGFRADKDTIQWVVAEGTVESFAVVHDKLSAPKSYTEAEALAWFRERVQTTTEEHKPEQAGIRVSETFLMRKPSRTWLESVFMRCRVEGIAIEAVSALNVPIRLMQLQDMTHAFGGEHTAKEYLASKRVRGFDLSELPEVRHEAAMVAISLLGE